MNSLTHAPAVFGRSINRKKCPVGAVSTMITSCDLSPIKSANRVTAKSSSAPGGAICTRLRIASVSYAMVIPFGASAPIARSISSPRVSRKRRHFSRVSTISTVRFAGGFSCAKTSRSECAGSTEIAVTLRFAASCRAIEAAHVVFPTPPFPARNVRRSTARSSRANRAECTIVAR